MAVVVTQSGNLVWQKVKNAITVANPVLAAGTNPPTGQPGATIAAFRGFLEGLKYHLAQQKRNIDLQFIPFAAEDAIANLGYNPITTGAGTLYGAYVRGRRTSATTKSFFQVFDANDNATSTATIITGMFNLKGQEFVWFDASGNTKFATGLTIAFDTAVEGATESTAALSGDGFVIVGV